MTVAGLALPRKRMAAGVLITNPAGLLLLVEPTYKDHWEIPGGIVDADESPYDAAVREVSEELALTIRPGRLLVVDWVSPRRLRTEGVNLIYDGGTLDADLASKIRLPPDELRSWAWCALAEAARRLSPMLSRRTVVAVEARSSGTTAYLEDGHLVV